jgi:hypothetical protein
MKKWILILLAVLLVTAVPLLSCKSTTTAPTTTAAPAKIYKFTYNNFFRLPIIIRF